MMALTVLQTASYTRAKKAADKPSGLVAPLQTDRSPPASPVFSLTKEHMMAIDCFIKFDGVEGESSNKDHKAEVDVLSWSWDLASAGQVSGTSTGKGKTVAGPLSFVHLYDKASPLLAKQCAAGKLFKTVVLTSRKVGEGQKDFLQVSLKDVQVTSVQPSGAGGDISETVTLTYRDIEFAYKPQDGKGGLGADVKFGWDVASAQVR